MRRRPFAFALLALVVAHPLRGQTPRREPAVLEVPASTRAMALGGAFQNDANDSDAVFYNPALVSSGGGFALGVLPLAGDGLGATFSATTAWGGGGVALGLQTLEYGTAASRVGQRAGGLDELAGNGPTAAAEIALTGAYSRSLFGLRAGLAARVSEQRLGGDRDVTASVDLGLASDVGPLDVGLTLRHLGEDLQTGGGEAALPTTLALSAGGYGQQVGPLDLGLAAEVARRADGEILVGGGLEIGYWPVTGRTFVVRIGGHRVPEGDASPLTLGGSFWGDDLVLDWAYQPVDGAEDLHRFTIGWR